MHFIRNEKGKKLTGDGKWEMGAGVRDGNEYIPVHPSYNVIHVHILEITVGIEIF